VVMSLDSVGVFNTIDLQWQLVVGRFWGLKTGYFVGDHVLRVVTQSRSYDYPLSSGCH
jgi:hypothetical protein